MLSLKRMTAALTLLAAMSIASGTWAAGPQPALKWQGYEAGLGQAKKDGRLVVADFSTSWCGACKKMDKTTFVDAGLVQRLSTKFITVKVDGDMQKDLMNRYGVVAYPTFFILDGSGAKLAQTTGYMSAGDFGAFLDYASTGACKTMSLTEFMKKKK